jgi:hypothetical protein
MSLNCSIVVVFDNSGEGLTWTKDQKFAPLSVPDRLLSLQIRAFYWLLTEDGKPYIIQAKSRVSGWASVSLLIIS